MPDRFELLLCLLTKIVVEVADGFAVSLRHLVSVFILTLTAWVELILHHHHLVMEAHLARLHLTLTLDPMVQLIGT